MKFTKIIKQLALLSVIATTAFSSYAGQVFLTEKPIEIGIPIGDEVIVKFPGSVTHTKILYDGDKTAFRQFLTPDGVLYLNTENEFNDIRMVAELVSGQLVVMDVKSGPGPHGRNIEIVDAKSLKKKPEIKQKPKVIKKKAKNNPNKPSFLRDGVHKTKQAHKESFSIEGNYVEMTKFAFRHFTGPSRLIGKTKGTPVKLSNQYLSRFIRVWKDQIKIKPLRQWRIKNKYVTVLMVNNLSGKQIHFDPRAMRGRIEFAASLHPIITPQGTQRDRTVWAIITSVPFNSAIRI